MVDEVMRDRTLQVAILIWPAMCALFALLSGPNGCVYIVQDENDRSIIFSVPLRDFQRSTCR